MYHHKNVLVLYVGGTIGMQRNERGVLIPTRNTFLEQVKYHSEMHDLQQAEKFYRPLKENELILPPTEGGTSVVYQIVEYNPLLDSCNMSYKDWIKIAEDIGRNYNNYNGFVVLHGTDTMAYTSSALSFMFEGLKKPIIVTGSQIPIFETRSDAKENFLASLIVAGCYNIPEVCVFFANKLFRGNRTEKISSNELDAFASPNYPTLADVGINMKINRHYIRTQDNSVAFTVHVNLNPNAAILTYCPTITPQILESFLRPPLQGLVLQSYGAGNLPTQKDILKVLKEAVNREVLIINVTQCTRGTVSTSYETGETLNRIGIVSGIDMTIEAALTKLIYVLGIPKMTYEEKVQLMKTDLRGEISSSN